MRTAKFVTVITVTDPDTNLPVELTIYKEDTGGMLGVDSSYLATEEPVHSPFGNGELEIDEN